MRKNEIEEIKARISKQVHELEDETALHILEEAVTAYSANSKNDIVDELPEEQQQRLRESIQQANEGKTISNDEVKQKAKEWLSK